MAVLVAVAVASGSQAARSSELAARARAQSFAHASADAPAARLQGIHKIKHIVIIMQENRSFDNYFGTYPHADGIPGLAGHPGTVPCLPQADSSAPCVKPFHDRYDSNLGGPYYYGDLPIDADKGAMTGFVINEQNYDSQCGCGPSVPANDAMGYHTRQDIPNYWKYADNFVLQDHMFASVASWSLPSHLFLTSGWSAKCTTHNDPTSCQNAPASPDSPPGWQGNKTPPIYAWTDVTYLLHKHHISWGYYIFKGNEPACESNAKLRCTPVTHGPKSLPIWYPVKWFDTVKKDRQTKSIKSVNSFFAAAQKGTLPAVSWVVGSEPVSEHPPYAVSAGQTYVTGLINTLMESPDWKSTAVFLTWDDWGGFYDNVDPPTIDQNGYGIRAPGLVISPYAKKGYIDRQTLSFDAYLKFIEDDFLGGQRIDSSDGRPDPRPTVRETVLGLGNLAKDFDFNQKPRKALILPVDPKTDLKKTPGSVRYGGLGGG